MFIMEKVYKVGRVGVPKVHLGLQLRIIIADCQLRLPCGLSKHMCS